MTVGFNIGALAFKNFLLHIMRSYLIMVLALSTLACKKDGSLGDNYISMQINGAEWVIPEGASAFINRSSRLLAISGSNESGTLIINLPNADRIGTYNLALSDGTTAFVFTQKNGGAFTNYSISRDNTRSRGTLVIQEVIGGRDGFSYAQGTFSGLAFSINGDSMVIENGKFRQLY